MIDTVIFDLGNVLAFHDNALLFTRMAQVFKTTPEAMKARIDATMWTRVNIGQLPGDALRQELVQRLGVEVSPEEWFTVWNCHFTLNAPQVELTKQLVGRLKLVLLSNTHDQHIAFLRPQLPVLQQFNGLVLSYEVGHVKPARAIYDAALQLAGTTAEKAVFFDDVTAFADAATALGIKGRVYTTAERCREQLAELGVSLPG